MTTSLPRAPAWFRFLADGEPRLGILDPRGDAPRWFDLGTRDVDALLRNSALSSTGLQSLLGAGAPMEEPERFLVPVPRPGKILCLAKNYAAHAAEFGSTPPSEPVFFAKLPDTLQAHGQPVRLPHWLPSRVDHELELGVILGFADPRGEGRKYVPEDDALAMVAGYTVLNDVTARKLQGEDRDQKWPWLRSKSFDTFCPLGPWVVPRDDLPDADDLAISLTVNGETRQQSRTSKMVSPLPRLLAVISRHTTLRPGDVIATGTPEGVGPLQPGDQIAATIDGIGTLCNPVEREPEPI